jgi:hypothetical protein
MTGFDGVVADRYNNDCSNNSSVQTKLWRGDRVAEGAALEKRFTFIVTWVRIPPSPPTKIVQEVL